MALVLHATPSYKDGPCYVSRAKVVFLGGAFYLLDTHLVDIEHDRLKLGAFTGHNDPYAARRGAPSNSSAFCWMAVGRVVIVSVLSGQLSKCLILKFRFLF